MTISDGQFAVRYGHIFLICGRGYVPVRWTSMLMNRPSSTGGEKVAAVAIRNMRVTAHVQCIAQTKQPHCPLPICCSMALKAGWGLMCELDLNTRERLEGVCE